MKVHEEEVMHLLTYILSVIVLWDFKNKFDFFTHSYKICNYLKSLFNWNTIYSIDLFALATGHIIHEVIQPYFILENETCHINENISI